MAFWTQLIAAVNDIIKPNGVESITGLTHQQVLDSIISFVGEDSTFVGIADPAMNPNGLPDGPKFWLTSEAGTYVNFGGVIVDKKKLAVISNIPGFWAVNNVLDLEEMIYNDELTGIDLPEAEVSPTSLSGASTTGKVKQYFYNTSSFSPVSGNLTKIKINTADSGSIKVHSLIVVNNKATSVASETIQATAGLNTYNINIDIISGSYVGIEINPAGASVMFGALVGDNYYAFENEGDNITLVSEFSINFSYYIIANDKSDASKQYRNELINDSLLLNPVFINDDYLNNNDLGGDDKKNVDFKPYTLAGNLTTAKSKQHFFNDSTYCQYAGIVKEIEINAADSGDIRVHVFKVDVSTNTAESVNSVVIPITSGQNKYALDLRTVDNSYIGVEISATYASIKYGQVLGGNFYGFENIGDVLGVGSGSEISFGVSILADVRLAQVDNFKSEIINDVSNEIIPKINEKGGIQLYRYLTVASDPDIIQSGWSFTASGATSSITGLTGIMYVDKQINIETKIHRVNAVLYADTNFALLTQGKEETTLQTMMSVNFNNNSLNIFDVFSGAIMPSIRVTKTIDFSLVHGRGYIIEMYRLPRGNGIRITDIATGESDYLEALPTEAQLGTDAETYLGGLQYDVFGVTMLGGTSALVRELSTGYFGKVNPLLWIAGDSITYGYGTLDYANSYAHLIADMVGNDCVISPRGGGAIEGVLEKIQTECAIIKPKYCMVTIGTNAAPTDLQLQQLVADIITIGSIPIINCIPCRTAGEQQTANDRILALNEYTIRFDLATATDPTANPPLADLSLYVDNGVHPNLEGFEKMVDRVRLDLPFII